MKYLRFLVLSVIFLSVRNSFAFDVHMIGDSHAFFCFTNDASAKGPEDERSTYVYVCDDEVFPIFFNIHAFVSRTMHRVGRDGINGLNISKLGVKDGDVVVFLFGEIDVRYHIGRQRDHAGRKQEEIIESLVHNYFKCILDNKKLYQDLKVVVVSVIPPCDCAMHEYPCYGSLSDRVRITGDLNNCIKKYCQKYSVDFLDIYFLYAQGDGSLKMNMSDGIVHVGPKHNALIKEALALLL